MYSRIFSIISLVFVVATSVVLAAVLRPGQLFSGARSESALFAIIMFGLLVIGAFLYEFFGFLKYLKGYGFRPLSKFRGNFVPPTQAKPAEKHMLLIISLVGMIVSGTILFSLMLNRIPINPWQR